MNVEPKDVNVLNLMFCVTLDVILAKLAVIIEIYQWTPLSPFVN